MAASFPTSEKSFTTKVDGVDYPQAAHINDIQLEVAALEAEIGATSDNATAVFARMNNLTADAAPVHTTDYIVTYDATATAPKKVLLGTAAPMVLPASTGAAAFNPADATTYYWGGLAPGIIPTSTAGTRRLYIMRAGTITAADILIGCSAGTSENSTISIRLNDTTDTTISSVVDLSSTLFHVQTTGLNIAVVAGDYVEIKWVTPSWSTNPTAVFAHAQLLIS